MPPEEHTLNTMYMAKLVLDSGFTAGRGAAAAKPTMFSKKDISATIRADVYVILLRNQTG
jgi:hypothetical protein